MMKTHLLECEKCRTEYIETKKVIENLRYIEKTVIINEDVLNMNKRILQKKLPAKR